MEWLIYALTQCLVGIGFYLAGYIAFAWLAGCRHLNRDEFWEQGLFISVLFFAAIFWSAILAVFEPSPFYGVIGWGGAYAAAAHHFLLFMVRGGVGQRNYPQPLRTSPRPRSARYTCPHCSAPVPDRMTECPCCFQKVPLTERADQLLPVPAALQPLMLEQLPRPAEDR